MDEEIVELLGRKRWEKIKIEAKEDSECIGRALLVLGERFEIKESLFGYVDMDFVLDQRRLNLTLKRKR